MAGRLEFYWYETKPGEVAGAAWGQLQKLLCERGCILVETWELPAFQRVGA